MAQDRLGSTDHLQYVPAPTREYRPERGYLPDRERIALDTIGDAVRGIARTYVRQINRPFYPPNIPNSRIIEEAGQNPDIFSPYTIVILDPETNHLTTIPAHEAFSTQLLEPIELLREAGHYTQDRALKDVVQATIDALENGEYENLERTIITGPLTDIGFRISLYNRYMDTRLGLKFAYSGSVGLLDKQETEKHQPVVDMIVDTYLKSELNSLQNRIRPNVRIRYNKTEVIGGLPAEMELTADSTPCQLEWREKYGTEIIVEEPPFFDKFHRFREPLIREIVAVHHRRLQQYNDLREAYGYRFDTHETMHALIRRPNDESRFGNEFPFMNEMGATVIGLSTVAKIGLSPKQLEGIFLTELAIAADEYRNFIAGKTRRESYLLGEAVLLNYLVKDGTLRINEKGEFDWDSSHVIFKKIEDLAKYLENILTQGEIRDARVLKRTLGSLAVFEKLKPFRPRIRPQSLPSPQDDLDIRNSSQSPTPILSVGEF